MLDNPHENKELLAHNSNHSTKSQQSPRWLSWLIAIAALAVILRIGAAFYLGNEIVGIQQNRVMDQVSYNLLAISLLEGRGYSFDRSMYPFTPAFTPTAHWSFLYPPFLSLIYAIFGPVPLAARLIQAVISGVLSSWLLYLLGKRLFGTTAGLVSALLGAVYFYFIYHDAALMTESFYALGVLASFNISLAIVQSQTSGKAIHWQWLLLGIVLGLTIVLRQTILLWVPFLFLWMIWAKRGRINWWGMASAIALIGIFILPWTIRNYVVYNEFLPLNSNAGYALYASTHPDHGVYFIQDHFARIPPEMRGLNEAQLSSALTKRGVEHVIQEPQRYFLLTLSKIPIFFNFWFSSESDLPSNLLRVFSYGIYLPFFLYGLILSRRNWKASSLILLFAVVYSVIHILTWSSIRYRLVIDATFMPFAALALIDIYARLRALRQTPISARPPTGKGSLSVEE
jgi:4-amino-4-deoxy-L-arabinose transferase-like glycosyltransferase